MSNLLLLDFHIDHLKKGYPGSIHAFRPALFLEFDLEGEELKHIKRFMAASWGSLRSGNSKESQDK
jgi:hypothetical protein